MLYFRLTALSRIRRRDQTDRCSFQRRLALLGALDVQIFERHSPRQVETVAAVAWVIVAAGHIFAAARARAQAATAFVIMSSPVLISRIVPFRKPSPVAPRKIEVVLTPRSFAAVFAPRAWTNERNLICSSLSSEIPFFHSVFVGMPDTLAQMRYDKALKDTDTRHNFHIAITFCTLHIGFCEFSRSARSS